MTKVLNKRVDKPTENSIYVGRPSKWGNPFVVGIHGKQGECVDLYKDWIKTQPELLSCLNELKGKDLICWCAPKRCHADILLELANDEH